MQQHQYVAFVFLLACGGSAVPQPEAPSNPPPPHASKPEVGVAAYQPAEAPVATPTPTLPNECAAPAAALCTPPATFVERLCAARPRQDVALALFAKTTPFTRMYLRGKFDELAFDEEVLILRSNSASGIVVNNATYDVLRWDGSCSLGVHANILTPKRPPKPLAAHVRWSRLDEHMQIELCTASKAVRVAHSKQARECWGATFGGSSGCVDADRALGSAIVNYLRDGGSVTEPQNVP